MKELIKFDIKGLKCDKEGCGFVDPVAKFEDYPKLVNTPCPMCGSNLLTEADMKTCFKMWRIADWINKWFGWLASSDGEAKTTFKVEMDGSGKAEFKENK